MAQSGSSASGPSRSHSQGEVSQMSTSTRISAEGLGVVLWTTSKYKDFQIVIGDRAIRVHKCVLASRSPVFAAMLTCGLTETTRGQVVIQDFDYETVEFAIKFLYSQRLVKFVNCSSEQICDLMRFGHKYDIQQIIGASLGQVETRCHTFDQDERRALIKLAVSLGSDEIIDIIFNYFAPVERRIVPTLSYDCPPYLLIGDALAKEDYFKDLKLICEGQQEFAVHKCILDLRSPVFAQLFSGRLTMTQVKPLVVKKAVEIFYTGHIQGNDEEFQNNPDLILGLLEFADKYKVERLVNLCLQKIHDEKSRIDKKMIKNYIKKAVDFESDKILHFIMGILGNTFDMKNASKESYWK